MVLVVEVLMENMSILMMKVIVYTVVLLLMDRAVAVLMGNTRNNCKNQYLE